MSRPYDILITNGTSSERIVNGTYAVTAVAVGYDITTIDPNSVTVTDATTNLPFTIGATGTLTLHVTETGAPTTPIAGATFQRCGPTGPALYGPVITTDSTGAATFDNVPFAATGAPTIYFKQLSSDGSHNIVADLNTTMTDSTYTMEISNPLPPPTPVTLGDANYVGLPIEEATITLS